MTREEQVAALRDECLACRKCAIGGCMTEGACVSNVFSNMNLDAKWMVVGQNPGIEEVRMGEPFVGISGRIFDTLVKEVTGLDRTLFYISNTVRCMTPGNRRPSQSEIDNCRTFLDREIKIINPRGIITLGGPALEQVTGIRGIMRHHGERLFSPRYLKPVFPMIHPSPLNTNDPDKSEMFRADLIAMKEFMLTVGD
jgi:DNA polymerase